MFDHMSTSAHTTKDGYNIRLHFDNKPSWLQRTLLKHFFGFIWKDRPPRSAVTYKKHPSTKTVVSKVKTKA